jgi:pilus assembly protein Flp/PilA
MNISNGQPYLAGGLVKMRRKLRAFLADESGATSIEYIVVASGVALAIVTVVIRLGTSVKTMFTAVTTAMK